MPLFLFHHFVSFGVEVQYFYDDVKNQKSNMQNIYTRVNQKKFKSTWREYVTWTRFEFWPTKFFLWKLANEDFCWAYSNSKEAFYNHPQNIWD